MSRLRVYAPLGKQSEKVKQGQGDFRAVYKVVDERSEGRCEYDYSATMDIPRGQLRCTRRATDHHHLYKPRRANHEPELIVHLCRHHHERCEWPYKRGRLVVSLVGGTHVFRIRFANDKFEARAEG